jgi:DNA (cytosine-5)-methyltransferase 1
MNELALFAGGGGGLLAGSLLGWNPICAVEIEEYPRKELFQRQRDGILPLFPIWDNIKTFDGSPWKGKVDIISGGFPCQDISSAGKGEGITGSRSGLWKEMARVVWEVQPQLVFAENSPLLTRRGLETVLGDLAEMGYDARWCVLGADDAGAPHRRKRIWILAYTQKAKCKRNGAVTNRKQDRFTNGSKIKWWDIDPADLPDTTEQRFQNGTIKQVGRSEKIEEFERSDCKKTDLPDTASTGEQHTEFRKGNTEGNVQRKKQGKWSGTAQPRLGRVAHGVAHRVDRLKTIGNGQVPAVAAIAFIILSEGLI